MNRILFLLAALTTVAASAAVSTNAPSPTGRGPSVAATRPVARAQEPVQHPLREARPNEIVTENHSCDGIAVELSKTRRPYELINPLAPAQYGPAEDNVARNVLNGQITGLKIFSIRF